MKKWLDTLEYWVVNGVWLVTLRRLSRKKPPKYPKSKIIGAKSRYKNGDRSEWQSFVSPNTQHERLLTTVKTENV